MKPSNALALIVIGALLLLVPPVFDSVARGHAAQVRVAGGAGQNSLPARTLGEFGTLFYCLVGSCLLFLGTVASFDRDLLPRVLRPLGLRRSSGRKSSVTPHSTSAEAQ